MFNVLFLFTDQMLSHLILIWVTLFYILHYVSLCDSHGLIPLFYIFSLPSATMSIYVCTKTYIHPLKRPDVENKWNKNDNLKNEQLHEHWNI